jgi:hypothetical protein
MTRGQFLCRLVLMEVFFGNALAEDPWYERVYDCVKDSWKNSACLAPFLLPKNSYGERQTDTKIHEWASYRGHVYGYGNVIEVRLRFNDESLQTLRPVPFLGFDYPFALEVDVAEANNGKQLKFDWVDHDLPDSALAVQDISAFNQVNSDSNADGLLIRDVRAIGTGRDYHVWFHLKEPLPAEGVEVSPYLQISYNRKHLQTVLRMLNLPIPPTAHMSPWNYYPLESENYPGKREGVYWKLYPDGLEGLIWSNKETGYKSNRFQVVDGKVWNAYDLDGKRRLDRLDKMCRETSPHPLVEQFRNWTTGHITIYRTPGDQTGYRYANSNCDTEGFALPALLDGDASGSGDTDGSEKRKKPNLRALDTFVTYGESASTPRVAASDRVFLGTPLWCQMKMDNDGSKDVDSSFYSACYVSRGKKFDGWKDAVSLGTVRVKKLKKGSDTTEHKGMDVLSYPGWYNVVSRIDVDDDITESDEKDNSFDKNDPFAFQVWGRPGISVGVTTDKTSYAFGENVFATAVFANFGNHPFGKTGYVDWYVDGAIVDSERDRVLRENLRPGVAGKTETAVLILPQHYGTHEIKACFRFAPDDLIEENNPADNCAVANVFVPDPNPPIIVVAPPLEFETVCGQLPPDPDFSSVPPLKDGTVGNILTGKDRHRLLIQAADMRLAGEKAFWDKVADFDPRKISFISFGSRETGWGSGSTAFATGFVQEGNVWTADIYGTPAAAKGNWMMVHDGKRYWLNPWNWGRTDVDGDGHVRYNGWKPNKIAFVRDGTSTTLVATIGTPRISGIWFPSGIGPDRLTGKAFWTDDRHPYPGQEGTISCDGEKGQFVIVIPGVEPGSAGKLAFGLFGSTDYAWQMTGSDWWTLPEGAEWLPDPKTGGTFRLGEAKPPAGGFDPLACGQLPPDPDFSIVPPLKEGAVGNVVIGNRRHRLLIQAPDMRWVGLHGFWEPIRSFDPSKVSKVCWSSNETNWGVRHSSACGKGFVRRGRLWLADIFRTPPASNGMWTIWYRGREYWAKSSSWNVRTGADGHVRYGGWKPYRMTLKADQLSSSTLRAFFGTPGIHGFWLPPGRTLSQLTGKAYWKIDGESLPGQVGSVACDAATGRLIATVPGVTPGSEGIMTLELEDGWGYAWQIVGQWNVPSGAEAFVNREGHERIRLPK